MKPTQSFFYNLFKENTLVLVEGFVWNIKNKQEDGNYFRWYTKTFGVVKDKKLRHLEEDYFENHREDTKKTWAKTANEILGCKINSEDLRLGDFALNELIRRREKRIDKACTLDELLNRKDVFICEGTIFDLTKLKSENNEVRINKTSYSIGRQITEVDYLEEDYSQTFREGLNGKHNLICVKEINDLLLKDGFYDRKTNIGFEKTRDGFFVYTLVEPYVLYEDKNKKYYKFGEAKVGIQIWLADDEIVWQDAVVMNKYMHPALASHAEHQRICTGRFSYATIRKRYDSKADQIKIALQKAKSTLERGYFSRNGAWNSLTEAKYKERELEEPRGWRVTNL